MRGPAALLVVALLGFAACRGPDPDGTPRPRWHSLFDGTTLSGWTRTSFGGEGEVVLEAGHALLLPGSPLTGVTRDVPFPHRRFELRLVAARLDGSDFFCGLTFPVGDGAATLIVGGWGGSLIGLSCIDGKDASENATSSYRSFDRGKDCRIRVRVDDDAVTAWVDDERLFVVRRAGHVFTLRPEVEPSRPLGVAAFATTARIGTIEWRSLP